MNGLSPSELKIEALIRAHILALDDDQATAGYVPGGRGSVALQRSELWHEGERQFLELERCYTVMVVSRPKQLAHLRGRYYGTRTAVKTLTRRGHTWIGLDSHQAVQGVTGGERVDTQGPRKRAAVTERVVVETWPNWVRLESARRGLTFVHAQFLRDRVEPCVPSSVWKAA